MARPRCLRSDSRDSVYSYIGDYNRPQMVKRRFYSDWTRWQKALFFAGIALIAIIFIIFLLIWVVFPLVFMNNIKLQRFFMFFNTQRPKNPDFGHPEKYGLQGVVNFYITTKDPDNSSLVSIGAWLVLPTNEINNSGNLPASELVRRTAYPIAIYLHGVGCNRILPQNTYEVLRKHFLLIATDHRGFGDSGPHFPPSEDGIVSDTAQVFRWLRLYTNNDIYLWGHSLGSALSTHTVKRLRDKYNTVPSGLILESAFTTMREEIPATQLGQVFTWMPWFEATVQRPLERNGFLFRTTTNILSVDCPIMILHAEDDEVIPCALGRKVADVARTKRDLTRQGNVTYHEFGVLGYRHTGITTDPNISKYIEEFIGYCKDQRKRRG